MLLMNTKKDLQKQKKNNTTPVDLFEVCKLDPKICDSQELTIEHVLHQVLHSRVLASLGDALVNYTYMVARVRVFPGLSSSIKVWDYSLAEAFSSSMLKAYLKKHKDKGSIGDSVEALLAFAHFSRIVSLDEQALILERELREIHFVDEMKHRRDEKQLAAFAFRALINVVEERLQAYLNDSKKA